MSTIRFIPNQAGLDSLLRSPDGAIGRFMQERGRVVQLAAIRDCPKRTGKLSESIRMRWEPTLGGQRVIVGAYQPYAIYVHEGTKAHVIKPKNASVLHFMINGQDVFAASVNHPGTKANRFLAKNLTLFLAS